MFKFPKQLHLLVVIPLTLLPLQNFGSILSTAPSKQILSFQEMSLEDRYPNGFVNDVFKNNILLNLAYLQGKVSLGQKIDWEQISKPFVYEFQLNPEQTFAFHDDILEKYKNSLVKTTSAHFTAEEGFKSDGYLFGDGVCHLASLLYYVAKEAQLDTVAPTNHNFANIPDIPREYGVSIYANPYSKGANSQQNLYITNNQTAPITFKFEYKDNKVKVAVLKD